MAGAHQWYLFKFDNFYFLPIYYSVEKKCCLFLLSDSLCFNLRLSPLPDLWPLTSLRRPCWSPLGLYWGRSAGCSSCSSGCWKSCSTLSTNGLPWNIWRYQMWAVPWSSMLLARISAWLSPACITAERQLRVRRKVLSTTQISSPWSVRCNILHFKIHTICCYREHWTHVSLPLQFINRNSVPVAVLAQLQFVPHRPRLPRPAPRGHQHILLSVWSLYRIVCSVSTVWQEVQA